MTILPLQIRLKKKYRGVIIEMINKFPILSWAPHPAPEIQADLVDKLEQGSVLHFDKLPFVLDNSEQQFLSPDIIAPGRKNISYDVNRRVIKGINPAKNPLEHLMLVAMVHRFANHSKKLVENLFPHYARHLEMGRTSFRPIEIAERAPLSGHKDDRLLHVDSFPATPVGGKRILRLFSNVHPSQVPRHWRLGASFTEAMEEFIPTIKKPFPFSRRLKQVFKLTRGYQTLYDYYMLNLHNTMKMDHAYQEKYPKIYELPSKTTWLVFTDVAPHAAMSGQYLLEQTFYLPPEFMVRPERSPLGMLEKYLKTSLIAKSELVSDNAKQNCGQAI
jgi:hypothetical protein